MILHRFATIYVSAFPEEFIRSEKNISCDVNKKNTLERFPYDTWTSLNDSNTAGHLERNSSLNQCERYCASKNECWGCIDNCQNSCQWIAVSQCDGLSAATALVSGDSFQKTGLSNCL